MTKSIMANSALNAAAGLTLEQRFATWDLVPFSDDADFAVTFLRVPAA